MIENMLGGIEIIREDFKGAADIYTGSIDEFWNYVYGELPYRTMNFIHITKQIPNFQNIAVVNYTDDTPYTRIIEHRHFNPVGTDYTIISYEYPHQWKPGKKRHYPMFDYKLYKKYLKLGKIIFAGRLGRYEYLNMNQAVKQAIELCKQIS